MVTGSRAEYGLLRWVIGGIANSPGLELDLAVTGMHLSPQFGSTVADIESDGFVVSRRIETLLYGDTPAGIARSIGTGVAEFGGSFAGSRPDLVCVLGDRFEILAAVIAAHVAGIPVAHIHGGEATEGAFDDAFRHSITKMSQLHFVSAEAYRQRVIQLGEEPGRVFVVGALGLDAIERMKPVDRAALESFFGLPFGKKNLLVTFHPVTLDAGDSGRQLNELLAALGSLRDTNIYFTMPNADTGGEELTRMISDFVSANPNACARKSLGNERYLSLARVVDGVVGNSSSGLIEIPALGKGTVNIGDRQRGRLRGSSVIDAEPNRDSISTAIARLYSAEFRAVLSRNDSPYGRPGASAKIVAKLREISLDGLLKKSFFDLQPSAAPA